MIKPEINSTTVKRFITWKEVLYRVAYSRMHLYRLIDKGEFPKPKRLGPGRVAFLEDDINDWIDSREDVVPKNENPNHSNKGKCETPSQQSEILKTNDPVDFKVESDDKKGRYIYLYSLNEEIKTPLSKFIKGVFGEVSGDENVTMAIATYKKGWPAHPYVVFAQRDEEYLKQGNTAMYCSISTIKQTHKNPNKISRKKINHIATYAILLDDIGDLSKCPMSHQIPELSVLMETSPENYQGLLLIDRCEDPKEVEAFQNDLIAAGFCDPGAKDCVRLSRVPRSRHLSKHYNTKLRLWNPHLRKSIVEWRKVFGLTTKPTSAKATTECFASSLNPKGDNIFQWLKENGWLTGDKDDNFYSMKCPWGSEHSKGDVYGAGYSPIGYGDKPQTRGFNCFHGHCAHRDTKAFIEKVEELGGPSVTSTVQNFNKLLAEYNKKLYDSFLPINAKFLPDLKLTKNDKPSTTQPLTRKNLINLADQAGITIRFNVMTRELELTLSKSSEFKTADILDVYIEKCVKIGIKRETEITNKILAISKDNPYHPMGEWITSKAWDGVDRISQLEKTVELSDAFEQTMWPTYLLYWLKQAVEAVCGWKEDKLIQKGQVIVLVGASNTGKTTWIMNLVPREYVSEGIGLQLSAFNQKDTILAATMAPIAELGEIDATFRFSDYAQLKNFLTRTIDIIRLPYVKATEKFPRMTVFMGSANHIGVLSEITGARRFWPVLIEKCNAFHGIDLQQLWAQAYVLWLEDSNYFLNRAQSEESEKTLEYFSMETEVDEFLDLFVDYETSKAIHSLSKIPEKDLNKGVVKTVTGIYQDMAQHYEAKQMKINLPRGVAIKKIDEILARKIGHPKKIRKTKKAWLIVTKEKWQRGWTPEPEIVESPY